MRGAAALAAAVLGAQAVHASAQPVGTPTAVRISGDGAASNRAVLVIMGDGWTADKQSVFAAMVGTSATAAGSIINKDGSSTTTFGWFPLNVYLSYPDIRRIDLVSRSSGIGSSSGDTALRGRTSPAPDVDHGLMWKAVADAGVTGVDFSVVILNTSACGGIARGSWTAVCLSGLVQYVLRHEFGHTMGLLGDEYVWPGLSCQKYGYPNVRGRRPWGRASGPIWAAGTRSAGSRAR